MNFSTERKKVPPTTFWLPRASLLQVFVAGDDAAFEVDFDAIISDDDLFHQLLHDHAVICVHDCAALDVSAKLSSHNFTSAYLFSVVCSSACCASSSCM